MNRNIVRFRNSLIAFALVVTAYQTAAFAQAVGTDRSKQAALVTEFEVNGMKVLLKRRPASATVSAGLFLRGGARNLTAQNAGIENFMLTAATAGSTSYPRVAMRRELARTGSSISSGANYDFSVLALASTSENFGRSWDIFRDVALRPAFAPE